MKVVPPGTALAVVANPQARRLRRDPQLVRHLQDRIGDHGVVLAPPNLDRLDAVAEELAEARVGHIGLVGGDGTLARALTALVRAYGDRPMPPVVPLGGGTMNTVARSMGVRGSTSHLLGHVVAHLEGRQSLVTVRRWMLEVDGDRLGFLFGNGLFARYIEAYEEGSPGPWRAAVVLLRAVTSALLGTAFARGLTAPAHGRIELDGQLVGDARWLVTAAGTVDNVGLGFRPFTGALEEPGSLSMIAIGCTPFALAFQLRHTWRGRPMRHPDVIQHVGRELVIHSDGPQPYNLDGDLGQTGPVTRVRVGPAIDFLVPHAPRALTGPTTDAEDPVSRQAPAKGGSAGAMRDLAGFAPAR